MRNSSRIISNEKFKCKDLLKDHPWIAFFYTSWSGTLDFRDIMYNFYFQWSHRIAHSSPHIKAAAFLSAQTETPCMLAETI